MGCDLKGYSSNVRRGYEKDCRNAPQPQNVSWRSNLRSCLPAWSLPFGYVSVAGYSESFRLWNTHTGWFGVILLLVLSLGVIAFSFLQKRRLLFPFGIALFIVYLLVFYVSTHTIYKTILGAILVHLSVGHIFMLISSIAACVFGVLAFLRIGEKRNMVV